jgi:predicted Zn-dependent peptidase
MKFKKHKLDNGFNIIGELNKKAKSVSVGCFVKTGARDETKQISGVSHFLEHMVFKGTPTLSPAQVNEAFDRTGAQFNAFTSEEMTVFYSAILPEYLNEITELWLDLMRPSLREEDFNIEKNVIKEEIAMYEDLPQFYVSDKCRELYFDSHPCGNSVLGSVKSIDELTAARMKEYFSRRYSPSNITLVCAGNFNWDDLCAVAEKKCSSWKNKRAARRLKDYSGKATEQRETKNNLSREHICLMSPAVSFQNPKRFEAMLLAAIIGNDVGSRFFWELVDKAVAEVATMNMDAMDGAGVLFSYLRCSRDKFGYVMDTVRRILTTVKEQGVTEPELQAAKNKILSAVVLKNELPMGRLVDLGVNWLYLGKYRKIKEDIQAVRAVTVEQVNKIARELEPEKFTQFSIGPAE